MDFFQTSEHQFPIIIDQRVPCENLTNFYI